MGVGVEADICAVMVDDGEISVAVVRKRWVKAFGARFHSTHGFKMRSSHGITFFGGLL